MQAAFYPGYSSVLASYYFYSLRIDGGFTRNITHFCFLFPPLLSRKMHVYSCKFCVLVLGQCVNSTLILQKNLRSLYYINHLFQKSNPQMNQKEGLFWSYLKLKTQGLSESGKKNQEYKKNHVHSKNLLRHWIAIVNSAQHNIKWDDRNFSSETVRNWESKFTWKFDV